jgi:hypothetical protein
MLFDFRGALYNKEMLTFSRSIAPPLPSLSTHSFSGDNDGGRPPPQTNGKCLLLAHRSIAKDQPFQASHVPRYRKPVRRGNTLVALPFSILLHPYLIFFLFSCVNTTACLQFPVVASMDSLVKELRWL